MSDMNKSDRINFRLGPDLLGALRAYTDRYERSDSDVIREALWMLLESKGFGSKTHKSGRKGKR